MVLVAGVNNLEQRFSEGTSLKQTALTEEKIRIKLKCRTRCVHGRRQFGKNSRTEIIAGAKIPREREREGKSRSHEARLLKPDSSKRTS